MTYKVDASVFDTIFNLNLWFAIAYQLKSEA